MPFGESRHDEKSKGFCGGVKSEETSRYLTVFFGDPGASKSFRNAKYVDRRLSSDGQ